MLPLFCLIGLAACPGIAYALARARFPHGERAARRYALTCYATVVPGAVFTAITIGLLFVDAPILLQQLCVVMACITGVPAFLITLLGPFIAFDVFAAARAEQAQSNCCHHCGYNLTGNVLATLGFVRSFKDFFSLRTSLLLAFASASASRSAFSSEISGSSRNSGMNQRKRRYKPRRWVVERTHSWLNRFRDLLVRWCKKAENYTAQLQLACAIMIAKKAGLFAYTLRARDSSNPWIPSCAKTRSTLLRQRVVNQQLPFTTTDPTREAINPRVSTPSGAVITLNNMRSHRNTSPLLLTKGYVISGFFQTSREIHKAYATHWVAQPRLTGLADPVTAPPDTLYPRACLRHSLRA